MLASLVEKEATVPDSYPLTLGALRLACNQATNRRPVVSYDDRTVENALVSLKSIGMVRFVHPSHGGRTLRYRHVADERWKVSLGALRVLAALALRGPQTVNEVKARVERQMPSDETDTVEALLDGLAARSPDPLAVRIERQPGEREGRWGAAIGELPATWPVGEPWPNDAPTGTILRPPAVATTRHEREPVSSPDTDGPVAARVDHLVERVDRLSALVAELSERLATVEQGIADEP